LHPVAPAAGALPAPATQCDQDVSLAYVPEVGSYDPPPGGWDYVLKFSGSGKPQYNPNLGQTGNLDGRWIRSIDSDLWNGRGPDDPVGPAPAGPAPGGVDIVSRPGLGPCGSDTSVLRILDPGDTSLPIGTEFPAPFDPPNNSRILLGLDLGSPSRNLLKAGITFSARLRTSPDAPAFMNPNPASGDGASLANGIGQVGVYFRAAGTTPEEGPSAGAGFSLQSGNDGGALQLSTKPRTEIKAVGALKFMEIYMTVGGGANPGTYDVNAYINGATTTSSTVGGLTVSLQAGVTDFGTNVNNYVAIGFNGTSDDAMIEIDYVAYKLGIFPPSVTPCRGGFHRGDSNNDGKHNISDAVNTLGVLFLGFGSISCQEAADSNDDGRVNISDAINSLGLLFLGLGNIPPPAVPGLGTCGPDPTPDGLGCASYTNC
jgi:hypothetical protein